MTNPPSPTGADVTPEHARRIANGYHLPDAARDALRSLAAQVERLQKERDEMKALRATAMENQQRCAELRVKDSRQLVEARNERDALRAQLAEAAILGTVFTPPKAATDATPLVDWKAKAEQAEARAVAAEKIAAYYEKCMPEIQETAARNESLGDKIWATHYKSKADTIAIFIDKLRRALAAQPPAEPTVAAPLDMVLPCPVCGLRHVDAPEPEKGWTNPPHKSHLCHGCGTIWRPASVPTNGVATVASRGQDDTWNPAQPAKTDETREMVAAALEKRAKEMGMLFKPHEPAKSVRVKLPARRIGHRHNFRTGADDHAPDLDTWLCDDVLAALKAAGVEVEEGDRE